MSDQRKMYYVDTPDGTAKLGRYVSLTAARAAMARKLPADFRALCVGPYTDPMIDVLGVQSKSKS